MKIGMCICIHPLCHEVSKKFLSNQLPWAVTCLFKLSLPVCNQSVTWSVSTCTSFLKCPRGCKCNTIRGTINQTPPRKPRRSPNKWETKLLRGTSQGWLIKKHIKIFNDPQNTIKSIIKWEEHKRGLLLQSSQVETRVCIYPFDHNKLYTPRAGFYGRVARKKCLYLQTNIGRLILSLPKVMQETPQM